MKKQSFQRFSTRALMILSLAAGFSCAGIASAAPDTTQPAAAGESNVTPVTVPVSILDALLQTTQLGKARPAMMDNGSFLQDGRLTSVDVVGAFGGWKANGVTLKSHSYSLMFSQDLLGRSANGVSLNNRLRLGVLGRFDNLYTSVTMTGADEGKQHTKVTSVGFYGQLQIFDNQDRPDLFRSVYDPQSESYTMLSAWGYLSHLSGNIVDNANFDSPWKGWAMSLNGSIEETLSLYTNKFPADEVGIRWSVLLKPQIQVGFNKLNFDSIDQLKGVGPYSGKITLDTNANYYYQFGVKLEYQGSKVVDWADFPVSQWNLYTGISYRNSSATVNVTLPGAGELYTSAVKNVVQVEFGAGFNYKSFRTSIKFNNVFASDDYHQHSVGLSLGYSF